MVKYSKSLKTLKKVHYKPGTMVYPLPAALISCGTSEKDYNLITISWIGTICTDPPMLSVSIRPSRHSYSIIIKSKQFVVNIPSADFVKEVDFCGVKSGRDINKWEILKLNKSASKVVKVPQVTECPVSIECEVKQVLELGSHHCFISKVVNVSARADLITKSGRLDLNKASLLSYIHGNYFSPGKKLGSFGYSVKK